MAQAWSYSRYKAFDTCPKQFYFEQVIKAYPFEETDAIRYGNKLHKAAELYIRDGTELPPEFTFCKEMLDSLNRIPGEKLCEQKLGLTESLEPCKFFSKSVWWRGIVDFASINTEGKIAHIIDYKTGRNARYADPGQLELMALATFKHYPDIDKVKAGLLYVVEEKFIDRTYTRDEEHKLWRKWLSNYSSMETAFDKNVWNPKPSGLCVRHCRVTECPHNGRNK